MVKKPSQAVILAAGANTRFWPLGKEKHKAMYEILGKPILHYTLEELKQCGIKEVVMVVSPHDASIQSYVGNGKKFGIRIQYAIQQNPLGMGDAVLAAKHHLQDLFFVLNASSINCAEVIKPMLALFQKCPTSILVATPTKQPWLYGIFQLQGNKVLSIAEKPKQGTEPSNLRVVGVYLLPKDLIPFLENIPASDDSFEQAITAYARENPVYAVTLKNLATFSLKYPWHLFAISKYLMDRFLKRGISKKAKISKKAVIEGNVAIGDNTRVMDYAIIKGPCTIGSNCMIGNNTLIRQYSSIGDNCMVGHDTEIKNSIIYDDVHFHKNFFGESIVDDGCRFGAGTITANRRLDRQTVKTVVKGEKIDTGMDFFGTICGRNVKTGINTSIMPGIKIGNGCIIGPNTNLLEDVEDNATLYAEFKQMVKKKND
ncbi:NTP transferase domain-containing protein [Candidatus Woesearchaeota archaeon]|nr:NTP transferase domain-containing protein [Candidatus Woesearchaeota archaeon]